MPDSMDAVQQLADDHANDAVRRHADRAVIAGRSTCANADCQTDIHPMRTALGAQLCLVCQRDEESDAKRRVRR